MSTVLSKTFLVKPRTLFSLGSQSPFIATQKCPFGYDFTVGGVFSNPHTQDGQVQNNVKLIPIAEGASFNGMLFVDTDYDANCTYSFTALYWDMSSYDRQSLLTSFNIEVIPSENVSRYIDTSSKEWDDSYTLLKVNANIKSDIVFEQGVTYGYTSYATKINPNTGLIDEATVPVEVVTENIIDTSTNNALNGSLTNAVSSALGHAVTVEVDSTRYDVFKGGAYKSLFLIAYDSGNSQKLYSPIIILHKNPIDSWYTAKVVETIEGEEVRHINYGAYLITRDASGNIIKPEIAYVDGVRTYLYTYTPPLASGAKYPIYDTSDGAQTFNISNRENGFDGIVGALPKYSGGPYFGWDLPANNAITGNAFTVIPAVLNNKWYT